MPRLDEREQTPDAVDYQKKIEAGHGRLQELNDAEQAAASAGVDQAEAFANGSNNATNAGQKVASAEDTSAQQGAGWQNNVSNASPSLGRGARVKMFMKRRGPALGIGGGLLGVAVGVMFMMQGALLQHIVGNMMEFGDWGTPAMERRFRRVMNHINNTVNPECQRSAYTCKVGRVSNKALDRMARQGIVADYNNGSAANNRVRGSGYPTKNPDSYVFRGNPDVSVPRGELSEHLRNNPRHAQQMLGRMGAMNMRFNMWSGKHMSSKFFGRFNIARSGGVADGQNQRTAGQNLGDEARARGHAANPHSGVDNSQSLSSKMNSKLGEQLDKYHRGGTYYLVAAGGCLVAKAPMLIAGVIAAEQIARIVWAVSYFVLEPESKERAERIDTNGVVDMNALDMETAATILTTPAEDEDGEMRAAVDSPLLQQAMGLGGRAPASEAFSPGLAMLQAIRAQGFIDQIVGGPCSVILNPMTMRAAQAVDYATMARRAIPLVLAADLVIEIGVRTGAANWLLSNTLGWVGTAALNTAMENLPDIEDAVGRELGDALGIGAMAFFSSGAAARHLPVLSQEDSIAWMQKMEEERQYQREMDIAALSWWDTSSRYTFLGSMQQQVQTSMVTHGSTGTGVATLAGNLLRMPAQALRPSTIAGAAAPALVDPDYCSYAPVFHLEGDEAEGIPPPGITAAGTGCYGLTPRQDAMSTQRAIDIVEVEGWVDPEVDVENAQTIDDLIDIGYIREDTAMHDYIVESCSDLGSGDYLFDATGCMLGSANTIDTEEPGYVNIGQAEDGSNIDERGAIEARGVTYDDEGEAPRADDDANLDAIPVFLLDFQIAMSFFGEDEEVADGDFESSQPQPVGEVNHDELFESSVDIACAPGTEDAGIHTGHYPTGYDILVANGNYATVDIRLCRIPGATNVFDSSRPVLVNSRVSGNFHELIQQMRNDLGHGRVSSGFRSMSEQQEIWARQGAARAAAPGKSNHQMGLAIDFQLETGNNGVSKPPGTDRVFDWLTDNAGNYGVEKLERESWHWEISPL